MKSSFFKSIGSYGLILGIQTFFILKFKKRENVSIPKLDVHFKVRPGSTDYSVIKQIFTRGELYFNYSKFLNDPLIIIDCGAHIGVSSMFFVTFFKNPTIYGFEANSNNYKYLTVNTNDCRSIESINKAVWYKNEILNVVDTGYGDWGYMVSKNNINMVESVEAITLDDFIASRKISEVDIVKLDIEGSEKEIFDIGENKWLSITKLIIIEFHERLKKGVKSIVEEKLFKNGFQFEEKNGENYLYSNQLM